MCSRDWTGSASISTKPRSAVAVLAIVSRKTSRSSSQSPVGAEREARILTGRPDSDPGVYTAYSTARLTWAIRSAPMPQSAKPLLQSAAVLRAISSTLLPSLRASSGSTHGWKASGFREGK